jgi:threonine aldolase
MDPDIVERNIRKPNSQTPRTSLICIENTHNRWSGAVVPMENLKALRNIADTNGIKIHFDGARVFNAVASSGHSVKEYAKIGDSLMFCLSKGLSSPVGSVLTGPKDFIDYGRRLRKSLGGGMRQAGILAAAGIISLTEMIDRLKDDHARAKKLALAIAEMPGIKLDPSTIQTNIIIFGFNHPKLSVPEFMARLKGNQILALVTESGIRFVTHKDIDDNDIDKTISVFHRILGH